MKLLCFDVFLKQPKHQEHRLLILQALTTISLVQMNESQKDNKLMRNKRKENL